MFLRSYDSGFNLFTKLVFGDILVVAKTNWRTGNARGAIERTSGHAIVARFVAQHAHDTGGISNSLSRLVFLLPRRTSFVAKHSVSRSKKVATTSRRYAR